MLETDRRAMTALDLPGQRARLDQLIAGQTLCSHFLRTAARWPEIPAQRWLAPDGSWHTRTWTQLHDVVEQAALGLRALGVPRGAFAAVLGGNVPEHVIADLAMLHAGVTPISLYPTMSAEQIAYVLEHSGAKLAIVADPAALARIRDLSDRLPQLRHVVMWSGSGEGVHSWADLLELGAAATAESSLEELAAEVGPEDTIQLVYTSGTTGPPKAVILTHRMILWQIAANRFEIDLQPGEHLLSYLPMAHLAERSHIYYPGLLAGCTTYFWPEFDTMVEGLLVARPAYMMGTPRVFEKLMARLTPMIEADPELGRLFAIALDAERARQNGEPLLDSDLAESAYFPLRRLLARVGLDECRTAIVSGAPPGNEIFGFFRAIGLRLGTIYGQTESGGGVTSVIADYRPGSAGRPLPGMEVAIADDGEILLRGRSITPGYYRDPEATAALLDADGWLCTGDVGELDPDGMLRIVGRKKDIIITSGGKNVTPSTMEALVTELPLVDQVCVVGDGRRDLVAVLSLNSDRLRAWAAGHGRAGAEPGELLADPELQRELAEGIATANGRVGRVEQIKRFHATVDEWNVAGGQLTPSFKLKRRSIAQQYEAEIEALYDETAGTPVPGARREGVGAH